LFEAPGLDIFPKEAQVITALFVSIFNTLMFIQVLQLIKPWPSFADCTISKYELTTEVHARQRNDNCSLPHISAEWRSQ